MSSSIRVKFTLADSKENEVFSVVLDTILTLIETDTEVMAAKQSQEPVRE